MVCQIMVSPPAQSVSMPFFPVLRTFEFTASATESSMELMVPDSLTIAVKIYESSENEILRSFIFFIKVS